MRDLSRAVILQLPDCPRDGPPGHGLTCRCVAGSFTSPGTGLMMRQQCGGGSRQGRPGQPAGAPPPASATWTRPV